MSRHPTRSTLFPYTTLFRSSYATQNQFIQVRYADPLPLLWSLRTEGRVHRVVPDGKDDVPTPETGVPGVDLSAEEDRKSTRLNSSHANISYAVFCLKKKIK